MIFARLGEAADPQNKEWMRGTRFVCPSTISPQHVLTFDYRPGGEGGGMATCSVWTWSHDGVPQSADQ